MDAFHPQTRKKTFFLIGVVAAVSVLAGLGLYRALHRPDVSLVSQQSDVTSGQPQIGGPFQLQTPDGKTVTPETFKGKWMWVYFGYAYCPDICPTGLQAMGQALDALGPLGDKLQPIFITVDPSRDTPEGLAQYQTLFHPRFMMLTGSTSAVQQAIRSYRVYAQPVHSPGATDYLVDHSSLIYLMDPEGRYVTHFSHQTPFEEMVKGLKPHLEKE